MLFNPCCCEEPENPCSICNEDFNRSDSTNIASGAPAGCDWVEESGDWVISSNRLYTTSSNAVIRGSSNARSVLTQGILFDSDGDQARIILKFVDLSNYWFAQATRAGGYVSIFQKLAGSDFEKARFNVSNIGTTGFSFPFGFCNSPDSKAIVFNSPDNSGDHFTVGAAYTAFQGPVNLNGIWGLGTGNVTGGVKFDNLQVKGYIDGCSLCRMCAPLTTLFDSDLSTLTAVIDVSGVGVGADPLSSVCLGLNNTFICDYSSISGSLNPCTVTWRYDSAKFVELKYDESTDTTTVFAGVGVPSTFFGVTFSKTYSGRIDPTTLVNESLSPQPATNCDNSGGQCLLTIS